MKKKSKIIIPILTGLIIVGAASGYILQQRDHFYKSVLELYDIGMIPEAAGLIEGKEHKILSAKDGCELVLSIYAKLKRYQKLEDFSRQCIDLGRGLDTAYDGLSHSLTSMGRTQEAIETLEKLPGDSPRLRHALAHLHTLNKNYPTARKLFLSLANESTWSMWIEPILKNKDLVSEESFLKELKVIINSKPTFPPKIISRIELIQKELINRQDS